MCKKRNSTIVLIKDAGIKKSQRAIVRKIDDCLSMIIGIINRNGMETLACCCGHRKYPMSIVIGFDNGEINPYPFELFTGRVIRRRRKFYKRDRLGYYYIPETIT